MGLDTYTDKCFSNTGEKGSTEGMDEEFVFRQSIIK
jgi:hypothetical protein